MNLGPGHGTRGVDPYRVGVSTRDLFVANSGPIWPARVPLTLEATERGDVSTMYVLHSLYKRQHCRISSPSAPMLVKHSCAVSKQKRPF